MDRRSWDSQEQQQTAIRDVHKATGEFGNQFGGAKPRARVAAAVHKENTIKLCLT